MKHRTLTLATAAGLLTLGHALASTYPALQTDGCNPKIDRPPGANGQIYFSRDCKTGFVLPRASSPIIVDSLVKGPSVTEAGCMKVFEIEKEIAVVQGLLTQKNIELTEVNKELRRKLETAAPAEAAHWQQAYAYIIENLKGEIAGIKDDIRKLQNLEPYGKRTGANINVHMKLDHGEDVQAYQALNDKTGIEFRAAPIKDGILSFGILKDESAEGQDIIKAAKIPGLNPLGGDAFADNGHVLMNGGASGSVQLTMPAVCNLIKNLNKDVFSPELLTRKNIDLAGFAANFIYDVPVTANVNFRFRAEVEPSEIMATFTGSKIRDEFTQTELSELILKGELKNKIEVEFSDGGVMAPILFTAIEEDPRFQIDGEHIYGYLFGQGMEIYSQEVESKMLALKMIQEQVKTEINPVNGKEIYVEHTNRVCSKWKPRFARKSEKKCRDVVHRERKFIKGEATAASVAEDKVKVSVDYKVQSQLTYPVKHSTGFVQNLK